MRYYAILEDTGERVLHQLSCDYKMCDATIKPHADIASSGWVKNGRRDAVSGSLEYDYCPQHAREL